MRMSDWSSDVCSSDLCSAGRATYASKLWPSSAVNFTVSPIPVSLSLGGSLCTAYANVAAEGRFLRSHVEAKVKDIAVLDDVVLALGAHLAGLLGAGLAAAADEVVVGDGLGADEAALEVGVDDAGGLRRPAVALHGQGARRLRAGGEEGDAVETLIAGPDASDIGRGTVRERVWASG